MFLFGRVLIPHVILKPWEVDLCRKPGKRAQEKWVAAPPRVQR